MKFHSNEEIKAKLAAAATTPAATKAEITKGHRAHLEWAKNFIKRAEDAAGPGAGGRALISDEVKKGLAANPAPYPTFNGKGLAYKLACVAYVSPDWRKTAIGDMANLDGNVDDHVSDGHVSDGRSICETPATNID